MDDIYADIRRKQSLTVAEADISTKTKQTSFINETDNEKMLYKKSGGDNMLFAAEGSNAEYKSVQLTDLIGLTTRNVGVDANGKIIVYSNPSGEQWAVAHTDVDLEAQNLYIYFVDTSLSDVTITLPLPIIDGFQTRVYKTTNDNNRVIVEDGVGFYEEIDDFEKGIHIIGDIDDNHYHVIQDSRLQDSNDLLVNDPSTESLTGVADTQKQININHTQAIEQLQDIVENLASASMSITITPVTIPTTDTRVQFTELTPSTDIDVLDNTVGAGTGDDYIEYKKDEVSYNAQGSLSFYNTSISDRVVTLTMRRQDDDTVVTNPAGIPRVVTLNIDGGTPAGTITNITLPVIPFTNEEDNFEFYYSWMASGSGVELLSGTTTFISDGGGAVSRPSQGEANTINTADGNGGWLGTAFKILNNWLQSTADMVIGKVGGATLMFRTNEVEVSKRLISENTDRATSGNEYIKKTELVIRKGTTANRPTGNDLYVGIQYIDDDLGYLIYWDGANWKNFTGMVV